MQVFGRVAIRNLRHFLGAVAQDHFGPLLPGRAGVFGVHLRQAVGSSPSTEPSTRSASFLSDVTSHTG